MNISMLRAKIHRAKVTEANLEYEGSISICPDLIKAAGFFINERVDVYNCNNGARFSTYVIEGQRGGICLNGAAARHVQKNDLVIICSYCGVDAHEAAVHKPQVVFVDDNNQMKSLRQEQHGRIGV